MVWFGLSWVLANRVLVFYDKNGGLFDVMDDFGLLGEKDSFMAR
jgi:hypothetical protein